MLLIVIKDQMQITDQKSGSLDGIGYTTCNVHRQVVGKPYKAEPDQVALEVPIALEYNGISHATVLATPHNLEDFAVGFSFTEGVVRGAADIYDIETTVLENDVVVSLSIASSQLHQLKLRRRSHAGRTGCGLCGLESLDSVQRDLAPLSVGQPFISGQAISAAMYNLRENQPLHMQTGATHAAGWSNKHGEIQFVREDVGRHNALDKLIGHIVQNDINTAEGFVVLSSRASFELVQKSAAAGICAVIAVSAPTSYAISMAESLNVMLAGFARGNGFTVYTHPQQLVSDTETITSDNIL